MLSYALVALTHAICFLGLREDKEIVQHAHRVVAESRRLLHQHGMGPSLARDYTSRS